MPPNPMNLYRENAVTTQTPGKVIVLLYEGAIRFLRQANEAIARQDYAEKGRLINRSIDIISELNGVLNMDKGGDIAKNLRSLYVFMIQHLTKANYRKDPKMIDEIISLLEELNAGWKQIAA